MSTTKNSIKAKLALAINLAEQCHKLINEVTEVLTQSDDDDLYTTMDAVANLEETDIDELMKELEDKEYFKEAHITENGDELPVAAIDVTNPCNVVVKIPVDNNFLIAAVTAADDNIQASIMHETDGYEIDIAMAEVKRGEIATMDKKPADNKDIDLYSYTDPYSEDYQRKDTIKFDDIKKALS